MGNLNEEKELQEIRDNCFRHGEELEELIRKADKENTTPELLMAMAVSLASLQRRLVKQILKEDNGDTIRGRHHDISFCLTVLDALLEYNESYKEFIDIEHFNDLKNIFIHEQG